jgi:uncharacterized protein YijF (DUF1287 family)
MKKLLLLAMLISLSSFTPSLKMKKVIDKATWQSKQFVIYYGGYIKIKYPNGDVPKNLGVCTDVIIRAYRTIGVDLQQLVHEDMLKNKAVYDKRQYSKMIDKNIDHRRTNNLRTYFTRQHAKKAITDNAKDYLPGDIVFWNIAGGHVGIVIDVKVPETDRYYVVHNRGRGPKKEDFLFRAPINDHYRWQF